MATRIAAATGNWTTAGTWEVVDSTSLLDSEAGNTALTTSYVLSSTFTPGAITIDGIAVKIASRASGSPSNTMTVALSQGASDVTGTVVTINVADIDAADTTQNQGGWYLFKFAAPVTLAGATAYSVKARLSATTTAVNLYRDATAGNWSRLLRTTTTGAPAATDVMHVIGEHTGAGTGNSFTVTMNQTATTDHGAGTDGVVALTIGKRGTLTYGASASTAYYLKLSGDLIVYSSGSLNVGTVGTVMPSTSSAVLEFDPVADAGMGLYARNGSSLVMQGNPITASQVTMTADRAAAATTLAVTDTTGWAAGQDIGIASTSRTPTETEVKTITSVDSGTAVTIPALTNAHGGGGTALVIAEVVYLFRNVTLRSATSTIMTYVRITPTATVDVDHAYFRYLGDNTATKRGVEIESTTGSCSFDSCVVRDCEDQGVYLNTASGSVTFRNSVFYNCGSAAGGVSSLTVIATSGAHTLTGNWLLACRSTSGVPIVAAGDAGSNYNNLRIAGCDTTSGGHGLALTEATPARYTQVDGLILHSNGGLGVTTSLNSTSDTTAANWLVWRNGNSGIQIGSNGQGALTLTDPTAFGNSSANVMFNSHGASPIIVVRIVSRSDASFSTATAVTSNASGATAGPPALFIDASLSQGVAHTQEVSLNAQSQGDLRLIFINPTTSATLISAQTNLHAGSRVSFQKVNGSATDHRNYFRYGTVFSETSTRHTASGIAWKLTPNHATQKLRLPGPTELDGWQVACAASVAVTLTAWVRKNATYNGSAPRLVVLGGIVTGVGSWGTDVIASLTVGADTWEQLSVTFTPTEVGIVQFYVDCDGTAGDVFVDDLAVA